MPKPGPTKTATSMTEPAITHKRIPSFDNAHKRARDEFEPTSTFKLLNPTSLHSEQEGGPAASVDASYTTVPETKHVNGEGLKQPDTAFQALLDQVALETHSEDVIEAMLEDGATSSGGEREEPCAMDVAAGDRMTDGARLDNLPDAVPQADEFVPDFVDAVKVQDEDGTPEADAAEPIPQEPSTETIHVEVTYEDASDTETVIGDDGEEFTVFVEEDDLEPDVSSPETVIGQHDSTSTDIYIEGNYWHGFDSETVHGRDPIDLRAEQEHRLLLATFLGHDGAESAPDDLDDDLERESDKETITAQSDGGYFVMGHPNQGIFSDPGEGLREHYHPPTTFWDSPPTSSIWDPGALQAYSEGAMRGAPSRGYLSTVWERIYGWLMVLCVC